MVFVVDKRNKPLKMCCPARARKLLNGGKASVQRKRPFTIRLNRIVRTDAEKERRP